MIISHCFQGEQPGPKILITGAVHGDETCGTDAILRVIKEFETGKCLIARGSVTFVPICNPQAYRHRRRFMERNLNRYLVPTSDTASYEARLTNLLCPMLAACDVLLDLHSYPRGKGPYVFVGPYHEREYAFAHCLGASAVLTGWQAAFAAASPDAPADESEQSTGTTEYARRFGAIAVTLECGQHTDPDAPAFAYAAIHRALLHLELTSRVLPTSFACERSPVIEFGKVFFRGAGGHFVRDWKHLDPVKANEIVALSVSRQPITVEKDGYILLPHAEAPEGAEWFYWGRDVAIFSSQKITVHDGKYAKKERTA